MVFSVETNTNAQNMMSQLATAQSRMSKTITRLSSGMRINQPDDMAGLSIAKSLLDQVQSVNKTAVNTNNAISFLQVGGDALNMVGTIMNRMTTLASQASNTALNDDSRAGISQEFTSLRQEVDRIGKTTTYNGQSLFQSSQTVSFQIGAQSNQSVNVPISKISANELGISNVSLNTAEDAKNALGSMYAAVDSVKAQSSVFGNSMQRLNQITDRLGEGLQNSLGMAKSNIKDADFASESANITRSQMLIQSGISALAISNVSSGSAMLLLR